MIEVAYPVTSSVDVELYVGCHHVIYYFFFHLNLAFFFLVFHFCEIGCFLKLNFICVCEGCLVCIFVSYNTTMYTSVAALFAL